MKRKRLDRDKNTGGWGFNGFPYHQMRVDIDEFHGLVCLIQLTHGKYYHWNLPIAGKTAVCGKGMTWLQLIPDGKSRVITAKYLPKKLFRKSQKISIWYVDIIENIEYDADGVAVFIDKYLDVIFTPQGDVGIDDRDELDDALESGDISKAQYDAALMECDLIVEELCSDIEQIKKTEMWCYKILSYVQDKIKQGEQ